MKNKENILTVIIPAFNEAAVIEKTISPYIEIGKKYKQRLAVYVVCNGCTDNTFEVVKRVVQNNDSKIELIDLEKGSKVLAINYVLDLISEGSVMVHDADVYLSRADIDNIINFTLHNEFLYASVNSIINKKDCSYLVEKYYKFMKRLPESKHGMVSSGVYILSSQARKIIIRLPDVIADDGYIKSFFKPQRLSVINDANSVVDAPKSISALIKIKTRSRLGNLDLNKRYSLNPSSRKNTINSIMKTATDSKDVIGLFIYCMVTTICRLRAYWQIKLNIIKWERDETSRC